jgi:hypothetical protein
MADLQRLEYHLQGVRLLASVGSRERYESRRKAALGACNRLFNKVPGERARGQVLEIKRQIREVKYAGDLTS